MSRRCGRSRRRALRIGLIGWGAINQRFAQLIALREPKRVEIVAIGLRDSGKVIPQLPEAKIVTQAEQLAPLSLDLVIEAASRTAVIEWGEAALRGAKALVVASASAFCDTELLSRFMQVAEENDSQIILPSGALAGTEALTAASVLSLESVTHSIVKPAAAWYGTEAEALVNLTGLAHPVIFFSGSAREVAQRFPKNANAAVIAALCGVGLDRTRVELVADPDATQNGHQLRVVGDFGQLDIKIQNRPLSANPKSSEMTALSLIRIVENRLNALVS